MISQKNYFDIAEELNYSSLPKNLQQGYLTIEELTEDHTTWNHYQKDKRFKAFADNYFKALGSYLKKYPSKTKQRNTDAMARQAAKELIRGYVQRGDSLESLKKSYMGRSGGAFSASIRSNKIHVTEVNGKKVSYFFPLPSLYNEIKMEKGKGQESATKKNTQQTERRQESKGYEEVEKIGEEVRFIKRYALMDGKIKHKDQIRAFITSLQRAILERRIRKTSPFSKEIEYIQANLIKLFHKMKNVGVEIKVDSNILEHFKEVGSSEKIRPSVSYLKRGIGLKGKLLDKDKVQRLVDAIKKAADKGVITKNDPYAERLINSYRSLKTFLDKATRGQTLEVHPEVLNGINDCLEGCGCPCEDDELEGFSGFETETEQSGNQVMNSMDFANLKFDSLGFTGKWKDLIGDPPEGFTVMVFGKPKMGKSYLCVDFAGYLSRNHGKTLYVAREEKLDATLQKKLSDTNVKHPNLFVSDHLPYDLTPYKFIFLDSVNKLGLQPSDLERLKMENPKKSFIYVHQTTKDGKFRGTNEFQHDVDAVIEVPEKGKAVQFGRFNQGGEMNIFDDNEYKMAA